MNFEDFQQFLIDNGFRIDIINHYESDYTTKIFILVTKISRLSSEQYYIKGEGDFRNLSRILDLMVADINKVVFMRDKEK